MPADYYAAVLTIEPNTQAAYDLWRNEVRRRAIVAFMGRHCCVSSRLDSLADGRKVLRCPLHGRAEIDDGPLRRALGLQTFGLPPLFVGMPDAHLETTVARGG